MIGSEEIKTEQEDAEHYRMMTRTRMMRVRDESGGNTAILRGAGGG